MPDNPIRNPALLSLAVTANAQRTVPRVGDPLHQRRCRAMPAVLPRSRRLQHHPKERRVGQRASQLCAACVQDVEMRPCPREHDHPTQFRSRARSMSMNTRCASWMGSYFPIFVPGPLRSGLSCSSCFPPLPCRCLPTHCGLRCRVVGTPLAASRTRRSSSRPGAKPAFLAAGLGSRDPGSRIPYSAARKAVAARPSPLSPGGCWRSWSSPRMRRPAWSPWHNGAPGSCRGCTRRSFSH